MYAALSAFILYLYFLSLPVRSNVSLDNVTEIFHVPLVVA